MVDIARAVIGCNADRATPLDCFAKDTDAHAAIALALDRQVQMRLVILRLIMYAVVSGGRRIEATLDDKKRVIGSSQRPGI